MSRYLHIRIDTLADAFNDRISEELAHVLNAPNIINRLCETECSLSPTIKLETSTGEECGIAWVTSKP